MIGLKDSVCAQIAVTSITGFSGWHREPPAARLYAVDPVGVETHMPSARIEVKCSSSPNISVKDIAGWTSVSLFAGPRPCAGFRSSITKFRLTWVRSPIDNDLVEYLISPIRLVGMLIFLLNADQLFY